MSKEVLLNKKSALELILNENIEQATDYKAQISVIDQELEDLGKPLATPEFLDKINETITEAIESLDLEDGMSCDFEIDYDNKIAISEARFKLVLTNGRIKQGVANTVQSNRFKTNALSDVNNMEPHLPSLRFIKS